MCLVSAQLADVMKTEIDKYGSSLHSSAAILNMSDWMSRVALESVGRAVLSHSFDPLDSPQNNPYTSAIKELMLVDRLYPAMLYRAYPKIR